MGTSFLKEQSKSCDYWILGLRKMLKAAAMILVATTLIASGTVLPPRRNVNVAADIDVVAVEERACVTEGQSCTSWINGAASEGCCSGLTCVQGVFREYFKCRK